MNKNGWTGGQYSLFRAVFGAYLFVHFGRMLSQDLTSPNTAPITFAAAASLLFALGFASRASSIVVALAGLWIHQYWIPAAPLFLAGLVPGDPYGSLAAHGRSDPGGHW